MQIFMNEFIQKIIKKQVLLYFIYIKIIKNI
jgi:hypothetical protein